MSLKSTTFLGLDNCLVDFFSSKKTEDTCNLLREQVVDSSNLSLDTLKEPNGIRFRAKTWKEKVLLGLYQWYCPREIGCLINLWLEENWGQALLELKDLLLTSKELALGAILESDQWSDRDFYGNILIEDNWNFFCRSSVRTRDRRAPKRTQRRRGYNDHGSMRLPHESEPSYDYKKLMTVVELEERRALQRQRNTEFRRIVLLRLEREGVVA